MNLVHIYAFSNDSYWLDAVHRIEDDDIRVITMSGSLLESGERIVPFDDAGPVLFLLDGTGGLDIVALVRRLRDLGAAYVYVVLTARHWKDARQAIRDAAADDCWEKTYVVRAIRRRVVAALAEIEAQVPVGNKTDTWEEETARP